MPTPALQYYCFDDYLLDPSTKVLYRNSDIVPLELKAIETLLFLVERNNTIVTKDDLLDAIWPNTFVEDSVLRHKISALRKAFGDKGNEYIATIPRVGFKFSAAVSVSHAALEAVNNESATPSSPANRIHSLLERNRFILLACLVMVSAIIVAGHLLKRPTKLEFKATQVTTNSRDLPIKVAAISPDGSLLAFADQSALFISDVKALERHPLPLPKEVSPSWVEWFPDGAHLLVSSINPEMHQSTVWKISVLGGKAELLIGDARLASISPDGLRLVFIRNDNELWLTNSDGSSAKLFATAPANHGFHVRPQFSTTGQFVIDGRRKDYHYQSAVEARDIHTGAVRVLYETETNIVDFHLINDNELLISHQPTMRSMTTEILAANVDLTKGTHSSPQVIGEWPGFASDYFSATRDGHTLSIINSRYLSEIHIADLDAEGTTLSNIRPLTYNDRQNWPTGWLPDNQTLLYDSSLLGHYDIYSQNIESTTARALAEHEFTSRRAVVAAGKKWLLYLDTDENQADKQSRLMRVAIAGGKPEVMRMFTLKDVQPSLRCATHTSKCMLIEQSKDGSVFFVFHADDGRTQELARNKWPSGAGSRTWDISPDGNHIAYVNAEHDPDNIHIMTIDRLPIITTLVHVNNHDPLRTLRWDAAGKGFYISAYNNVGDVLKLLHVGTNGAVHVLRQQTDSVDGWAVPSPDGRHLAFQQYARQSNIWLLQRQ